MKNRLKLFALTCTILLIGAPSHGVDLSDRWGIGVSLPDITQSPALSLRFVPSTLYGLTFMLGFDSDSVDGHTVYGLKLQRYINLESALNFYLGVGGYYISQRTSGTLSSGVEIDGIIGVEFFFPGLPNLGFQVETGVGYQEVTQSRFKTLGSGFIGTAAHYYF